MDDLHLARAARSGADADRRNGEPLRDECGEFGGYQLNDDRRGASRLQRERIGEKLFRGGGLFPLGACAI